jgi:uncharacterized protein with ParB-like and HNH nuclease domain
VEFNPPYQRDLVWTEKQKEELLESVFNRINIGSFVFIEREFEEGKAMYEILDGKQRLSTLIEFYTDNLSYKGIKFSELSKEERREFKNVRVSVGVLNNLTEEEKIKYFIKLNTTGTPVDKSFIQSLKEKV